MNGTTREKRRAERRHLTALFSDLSDSTALASSVDPEDFAELLDQLNQTFEQIIHRHGGTISQVRGDGVFAVFGLDAREDEGRRATEAALELHQAVKNIRFNSPLPGFTRLSMHSGIHSGLVLAVEGDQLLGRFVLVGEAANLASRLSETATADEILASDTSLGAERYFFDTDDGREFTFNGIQEPLTVYAIHGRSAVNTRFEARASGAQTALVGRERELSTLRQIYDQCAGGQARAVSIVGPAGLGKTRLAEEFIRELADANCRVLRGYCESYLHAEPLQPLLQILRNLLDLPQPMPADADIQALVAERLADIAPHLAFHAPTFEVVLNPAANTPGASEEILLNALSAVIQELAASQPLILFIDDWQWADDKTRVLFRTTPALEHSRLMLIQSSRETVRRDGHAHVIELEPLEASHGTAMIDALAPGTDAGVLDQVLMASGGNPLFIEELCHGVMLGAATPVPHKRWHAAQIPGYLSMLITSRVALLTGEQLQLLHTLAALGHVVPGWLLDTVIDVHGSEKAMAELTESDFIFPGIADGSIRFKHGITREVVLNSLNPSKRQALHLRVARDIETRHARDRRDAVLETLAYQYGESTEHVPAADYAEQAADKALAASAMDRARMYFQATLRALDRLDEDAVYQRWMAVTKKLAMACLYDAEREQCTIYERAIELAERRADIANQADAEYWLAYINYALGDAPEAILHIDRASTLSRELPSESLRTQILATWGQVRGGACDYDHALPALDGALAKQAPFKEKPRVALAYAYSLAAKGMVLGDQGQFDDAFACMDEALALTEGPVHPTQGSIVSMRTAVLLWQGRWDEAVVAAKHNVEIADRLGSRYLAAAGSSLGSYARWHQGSEQKRDQVVSAMVRDLALVESNPQQIWTSLHFSWLCELLVQQGRYQEARRSAAWALKRARKRELLGESVAYCALARLPGADSSSAERYFVRARASAEQRNSKRELALIDFKQGIYFAERGNIDQARETVDSCRDRFSGMAMFWHAGEAQRFAVSLARS